MSKLNPDEEFAEKVWTRAEIAEECNSMLAVEGRKEAFDYDDGRLTSKICRKFAKGMGEIDEDLDWQDQYVDVVYDVIKAAIGLDLNNEDLE